MSDRYVDKITELIAGREKVFHTENSIQEKEGLIPDGKYPLEDNQWVKIPDVICVFVDIKNSTGLSAVSHDKSTASVYELFTGTAIRLFHEFGAEYIDIKGDGVFALFSKNQVHTALVATMSFKTFVEKTFLPLVKSKLKDNVKIGSHIGIDQKTVLVKKLGLKNAEGRDIRQNEVWAGKPINMASKLASLAGDTEILVSDRFYKNLSGNDLVQKNCGCEERVGETGTKVSIWNNRPVPEDSAFDFDTIYSTTALWCINHGKNCCEQVIALDE